MVVVVRGLAELLRRDVEEGVCVWRCGGGVAVVAVLMVVGGDPASIVLVVVVGVMTIIGCGVRDRQQERMATNSNSSVSETSSSDIYACVYNDVVIYSAGM